MLFGVLPPYRQGVVADPEWISGFARAADELGFESIYVVEHVAVRAGYAERYPYAPGGRMPLPDDCPIPDPLDLLAFLAGVTRRIVLATGILVLPAVLSGLAGQAGGHDRRAVRRAAATRRRRRLDAGGVRGARHRLRRPAGPAPTSSSRRCG